MDFETISELLPLSMHESLEVKNSCDKVLTFKLGVPKLDVALIKDEFYMDIVQRRSTFLNILNILNIISIMKH
jgi:hypothetical protein